MSVRNPIAGCGPPAKGGSACTFPTSGVVDSWASERHDDGGSALTLRTLRQHSAIAWCCLAALFLMAIAHIGPAARVRRTRANTASSLRESVSTVANQHVDGTGFSAPSHFPFNRLRRPLMGAVTAPLFLILLISPRSETPARKVANYAHGCGIVCILPTEAFTMFTSCSNVQSRKTDWLWSGRIPFGAITIIESNPGSGKSTLTLDIAARVTRGREMPDGSPGLPPANVVVIASEDDLSGTILPRLDAAGADRSRVIVLDSSLPASADFQIPRDLHQLDQFFRDQSAKLLIFDQVSAYLDTASNSDVRVRRSLSPLAQFAAQHACAVVAIRHFRKSESGQAIHRGTGSIAFAAAARSVLAVVPDPGSDDEHRQILVSTKSNLGPLAPSLAYRTVTRDEVVGIEWLGTSNCCAGDLHNEMRMHRSQRSHAMFAIYSFLKDGPVRSTNVEKAAREAGVAKRTFDRAAHDLRLVRRKYGSGVGSFWTMELPDDPELLAALRSRDLDELMNALCHGVPDLADHPPQVRREKPHDEDHGSLPPKAN